MAPLSDLLPATETRIGGRRLGCLGAHSGLFFFFCFFSFLFSPFEAPSFLHAVPSCQQARHTALEYIVAEE